MENNEKNINSQINETKDVENTNAEIKKDKKIVIILAVVVLVLLVATGIGGGILLSQNGGINKNKLQNEVTNNSSKSGNENIVKLNKKIDESKPVVYTADYCLNNENKKAVELGGQEYYSKDYLIVPFININSDYAKKANEEIKKLYDAIYKNYGEKINGGVSRAGELKYEYGLTDKILSVSIVCREGVTNAGWSKKYIIYNINLETLKEASFEEVYKECGFESADQLSKKIKITVENDKENIDSNNVWDSSKSQYYMNSNKEFNIIVMGNMEKVNLTVRPNAESLPDEIKNADIVNTLSASGWAGSSMNKIRLYSNGDAYLLVYNGNGETEDCVVSRELLAKKVESIENKSNERTRF